ncbi:unannotated protein [freshwater metagenome]|uniref:Unannotated protein n=1 Tax=freshwater metagenome TaxID=449393 RepID=A0A6J7R788_9ZZZZ
MREVGRPQDVLDPDVVAKRQADLVVEERGCQVAVPVLTGLHSEAREVVAAVGLAVETLEESRDPVEVRFDEDDLQQRKALERAGEDPPGQWLGECERRHRREDRRLRRGVAPQQVKQVGPVAQVMRDCDAGLGEHRPQGVVGRLVVLGQAELARMVRKMDRSRPERREPQHLGGCVLDVDDGYLVAHGEPVRIVSRELGEQIGEPASDRAPVALHETEMPERADFAVENLGPHAVAVHGREARHRVVITGIAHGLHVPGLEREDSPAAHGVVGRSVCRDRVVERILQRLRNAGANVFELDRHVRIGRDELGHSITPREVRGSTHGARCHARSNHAPHRVRRRTAR